VGRLTDQARAQKEAAIRAAMDRLLSGEIPAGGKCDVKTLAVASGVTRAALYSTYRHLKEEFEQRRGELRDAGIIADPRDAQIERLKDQVRHLTERLVATQQDNDELIAFRTLALSRLAAQHEEILRLRAAASVGNLRGLASVPDRPSSPQR
jgi:DNA-binding transcriptional ArsR family regulator